ncbi:uncharacterized protein LOC132918100 [Rhopalosiphum padi]|uniref:uncharacterized protein LOC132918100 n=1 Tax=Rhopalosiphum padi TaxID=40932 RepID=UPI00298EAA2A|nr:uncharacterized protein LOC132918100 [Rhopalosiphum padi]
MPKVKTSKSNRLTKYVNEFGKEFFSTDGEILFCKICEIKVASEKKFTVVQHISRDKHVQGLRRRELKSDQQVSTMQFINENQLSPFSYDLTNAFLSANIPLNKLENPILKGFLENCEVLEKANHSTVAKMFNNSLSLLWPGGIQYDNVLLFVSDAAPYMVKAGKSIQSFYSKMIHVTCIAHALHRVAEEIRGNFSKVDKLVSNGKKIFLKAPSRVEKFREIAKGIPLPPQPVITRWGTWLNASIYYCEHFESIKEVVNALDSEDAISIKKVQTVIKSSSLHRNLIYIKAHFGTLPESITKLETRGQTLSESLRVLEDIRVLINEAPNEIGTAINKKMENVLNKNKGLKILQNISKIINGEKPDENNIPEDITTDDISHFKYAPVSSVEVERSFSTYKSILSDQRRSFLFENIRQHIIIQCNSDFVQNE